MSNLRLKDHTWDAANVYDSSLGKAQDQINAEVGTSLAGKQATLVSGVNIKTINGASILEGGNIEIEGGGGSSVVNKKAPAIYDTASAAIVSFEDGADGMPLKSLTVNVEPVQAGSGDPSPDNVRPITGWTGCAIEKAVYNLFDASIADWEQNVISADGSIGENNGWNYSQHYFPVKGGTAYFFMYVKSTQYNGYVAWYDANKGFIKREAMSVGTSTGRQSRQLIAPANACYYRITTIYEASVGRYDRDTVQIGLQSYTGDQAFTGAHYAINWQTEAGTVYAGALNLITGELRARPYYASYNGQALTGPWISDRDVYASGTTPTTGAQVVDLGNAGTLYQLDPVEIKTLLGKNNIWADCGDVKVEYPADTKPYIQKIAEKGTENAYEGANIYPNSIINVEGDVQANPNWWSTGLIPVDETAIAYYTNTTKCIVTEHTERTTISIIKRNVVRDESLYYFSADAKYFRLSFLNVNPVGEVTFVPVYNAQTYGITSAINRLANPPLSWGRENVLSRARHFLDIEWTPVAPFPLCTGSHKYRIVPAGEKQVGLPYSSTRNVAKLIGVNISIYTFMTALANPRSVLYTRKITTGYLGASYYGQHCASFVAYANGDKGCAIDSLGMADIYCKEISKYELQPGDMLISAQDRTRNFDFTQHCLLVYDISRDKYGRIDTLQIVEGNKPYTRYNEWTYFSDVESKIAQGYKCYRGNTIDATPYELCDFVKGYPDETLPTFVYPDIMPEYGDKACVEAGTDVVINVIDAKSYTQIKVYKNNTLIDTKNTIADFTIENIAYGKYRFEITDGTNTSSSYLIAADVHGTYDSTTGIVTFSSANATPVAMQSYADEVSKPDMSGAHNLEHLLTAEEISNGQASASDIVSSYFPDVQVSFLTEYGTAVWSSHPLNDQWEYWNPNALQILTNPLDKKVRGNNSFSMTVEANSTNVDYDWQYYYENQWTSFQNANAATLTKTANTGWNGWKIRCIVTDKTDSSISATSREALLTVT